MLPYAILIFATASFSAPVATTAGSVPWAAVLGATWWAADQVVRHHRGRH